VWEKGLVTMQQFADVLKKKQKYKSRKKQKYKSTKERQQHSIDFFL
jgi:hypothetical protein